MYRPATPSRVDQIWTGQKRKLQLQFSTLTDEDLIFQVGKKHEMIDRISAKLGKTETEMKIIFQSL